MKKEKPSATEKIALLGLLTALCFGLSYIEFLIPFSALGIPGIKLGLANICVTAALYAVGTKEAAAINLIRIILSWLIFGSFTGLIYSLAGGALSFAGSVALKKSARFSPIGVSAAAGALHNIGQLAAAMILTDASALMYYIPVLIVCGLFAGAINGFIVSAILSRVGVNYKGE